MKPRAFTPDQERAIYQEFLDGKGARGVIAALARKYRVAWTTIDTLVDRQRSDFSDSRGTTPAADL